MKTLKYTITAALILSLAIIVLAFQGLGTDDEPFKVNESAEYKVVQKWEMPGYLKEISGIAWLPDGTMACVQDEEGEIFIYDLKSEKIVQNIHFADNGDYEGIAVNKGTAYVMRSDGKIFEVERFRESGNSKTLTYQTEFSSKNNMETLAMSSDGNYLITAPKDRDRVDEFKGMYKINLDSRKIDAQPMVKINMEDDAFVDYLEKKVYKTFSPSDAAVNPVTGEFYILEGIDPKLVILKKDGTIKKVIELDDNEFKQPEGITFSKDGKLYISNESSKKTKANILQVELSTD
ncbi:Uncharacterized protein YjiK [Nonlabens sp. Hel1_33_55]|uniref:SdiA-regulated domain-containing protein n=1 Tax=Nonlabens sp. Hel1_33_55 TaxID=1336802 RepID=UPI000875BBAD|nr:SdiA-regulated domain-containing protein [Nonlabens sp. Hel1_33_55]SCX98662.1 Uncharacterized protein YjiK [Nonlabens sp. Hel1_33_55]